jgi:hypothetical protein
MMHRARFSRALAAAAVVLLLAAAVPAAWLRITVFFSASFDQKGAPGQQAPLVADQGSFIVGGPGFSVVPTATGGGALLAEGLSAPSTSTLTALFEKVFKGPELQVNWTATVGGAGAGFDVRALEDNDGEIIDVGWDGDGSVDVDDVPVGEWAAGTEVDFSLTLRDTALGADLWVLTMSVPGQAPVTSTGVLQLSKPLTVKSLQFVVHAGATGTLLVDDVQVLSASFVPLK